MFLLDSNVLSELRSAERCDLHVRAWQENVAPKQCCISVITCLEIRQGIEKVRTKDRRFAEALDSWLGERIAATFGERILPVTRSIAERAGRIAAGRTRGLADCLIAATALEEQLVLATRNIADFADIPKLALLNPWDS